MRTREEKKWPQKPEEEQLLSLEEAISKSYKKSRSSSVKDAGGVEGTPSLVNSSTVCGVNHGQFVLLEQ